MKCDDYYYYCCHQWHDISDPALQASAKVSHWPVQACSHTRNNFARLWIITVGLVGLLWFQLSFCASRPATWDINFMFLYRTVGYNTEMLKTVSSQSITSAAYVGSLWTYACRHLLVHKQKREEPFLVVCQSWYIFNSNFAPFECLNTPLGFNGNLHKRRELVLGEGSHWWGFYRGNVHPTMTQQHTHSFYSSVQVSSTQKVQRKVTSHQCGDILYLSPCQQIQWKDKANDDLILLISIVCASTSWYSLFLCAVEN